MTRPWPNPADTPLDRRSLIARAYRDLALKADPEACEKLDKIVTELGEGAWLIDQLDDGADLVSRTEVARRAGVKPNTVSTWVDRGDITRYPGGYRWSEVDEMLARRRRRRSAARVDELDL